MTTFFAKWALRNAVNNIVRRVCDEIATATDEKDTALYLLFGNTTVDGISLFNMAKSIFSHKQKNSRALEVTTGWNMNRATLPTIHVIRDSEQEYMNGIGRQSGSQLVKSTPVGGEYKDVLETTSQAKYSLLITSDNELEVEIVLVSLRVFLDANKYVLSMAGFNDFSITVSDINLNPENAPNTFFSTIINVEFWYTYQLSSAITNDFRKKVCFNPKSIIDG